MTRSMYRSWESSAVTSARVSTVCMNVPGSAVRARAAWIVRASSAAVRADSLPPFKMAALPVLASMSTSHHLHHLREHVQRRKKKKKKEGLEELNTTLAHTGFE